MTLWLYSLLLWLAQPLLVRKLRRRARVEPEYGEAMHERWGYYGMDREAAPKALEPLQVPQSAGPVVWIHAVSLGETRAAAIFLAQLRVQLPGMRLLLTHGTATGRAQGRVLLQPGDIQVWQPWDTRGAVQRFLAHFKPQLGLLMETEVWPTMVAACAQAHVPLCLVNARMSEKSLRQAQRLAWLSRPAFGGLHAVWAQTDDDAARLVQLGAPVQGVMGNFKFDATPDAAQLVQGRAWRAQRARPVLMFASSREGEERLLLDKLKQIRSLALVECAPAAMESIASDVQWLIVPRHPQRFDEVAALCVAEGFTVSRRSSWASAPQPAEIWLGDSLGEMAMYFALSDTALLGGSFAPLGGQNLIEAAACACPVVMGPHTFNFAEAAALAQAAGAAFEVVDMAQAVDRALTLVQSAPSLKAARDAAHSWGLAHRGAAERTALAVRALLEKS